MATVIREFHPVGHGAFFTEQLCEEGKKDVIVVYDCGCKTKDEMNLLEAEVNKFFNPGEKIGILFISHFDGDHVNGIKLLKPYIDNETHLLMPFSYEYYYLDINSPVLYYMGSTLNLLESAYPSLKQYWIRYTDRMNPEEIIDYRELTSSLIDSGTQLGIFWSQSCNLHYKWMYVPFNLYNDIKFKQQFERDVFKELSIQSNLKASALDEIAIKKLRDIYKKIGIHDTNTPVESTNKSNGSKNINENSLFVLSKATSFYGCRFNTWYYQPYYHYCNPYLCNCDGSCLYTGDANLKSRKSCLLLKSILSPYVSQPIFLFQLPHHGSRQYYGKHLINDFDLFRFLFINCGENDFQQRSFSKLFVDLIRAERTAWLVTNMPYTRLTQHIEFS